MISLVYCPAALAGDGEEYSQNAQILLSQLGSLGKLTAPEAPTVSRADFLYTLMSALKIDVDAPAPQSAFSDLDQGHFVNAAASAALQMGIASPNERFRPDDPILYAEALKLCVGAAGYEVRAIAGGGYPAGHLSVAGSIGLSRQVSAGLYNTLSGAQCITLLYNTLCADRMRQTGFGENFEFSVTRGETILSELYQLYKINGIVDATPVTGLNLEGKGAGDGRLMVDGILYHYENEDAENLLGMRVAAFYRKADSEPYDILALAPEKNETIIIQPEKVTEASDQSIRCQEEDKSQTYRLSKDYDMVFNGKAVKLEADVTLLRDAGKIRLLDHDGDGSYDLIFIEKIQYLYISGINTAKQIIYDKNSADRMLDLSEPDCRYTLTDQKSGQKVELESLQQGKLLGHLTSADGQYSRIFLFSDLVSGTVTAARPEEKLICVGEAWYRLSDYYLRYYGIPDLGANATFLLGLEGEIAALSTANTAMSYGFLVKARAGGGMLQPPEVKLFTQSGAMLVASLADHVLLDGNRLGAAAVLEKLTDGEKTKSQLIRFLQNGEDEIIKIDTKEPGDPTHRPENSFVPKDAGDNDKLFLHRFGTEKADAAGENPTWSDLPTEAYTYR